MARLQAIGVDLEMPDKDGRRKLNAKLPLRPEFDLKNKGDRRANQKKRAEAVYKMLHLIDESTTLRSRKREAKERTVEKDMG